MCMVSVVGDFYQNKWKPYVPDAQITVTPIVPLAEFEQLKRDVADMKELLRRAKKYDEDTGQPACEKDEKVALLKAIAKLVGVDLSDVFGPAAA